MPTSSRHPRTEGGQAPFPEGGGGGGRGGKRRPGNVESGSDVF